MKRGILLFLFALIVTIIILELVFRMVWENNVWWVDTRAEPVYQYPINKYGFRDFGYEKEKPSETVRVICMGDSFTWGDGIKFDDTYPKRLERELNYYESPKTGKKYEVLNISWCGYSTFQEINKLEFIKEFQPDLIFLGYCLNDSEDWADPKGVIALRHRYLFKREPNEFLEFLYRNFYLFSFIANRLSNLRIALGNVKYYKLIHEDTYIGWSRTKESFKILSEQDIPVIVLVFPLLSYSLDKGYPFLNIHKKIKKELGKNGLPYIDFYNIFKDEGHIRLEAVPYKNPHPSEIANRVIEEILYNKLITDYKDIIE